MIQNVKHLRAELQFERFMNWKITMHREVPTVLRRSSQCNFCRDLLAAAAAPWSSRSAAP